MRIIERIVHVARRTPSYVVVLRNSSAAWERVLDRIHGPGTTPGDLRMRESGNNQILGIVFVVLPVSVYLFLKANGLVDR